MRKHIPRTAWIIPAPALTVTCVSASVVLCRRGYALPGLLVQLVGPVLFALTILIEQY